MSASKAEQRQEAERQKQYARNKNKDACTPPYFNNASTTGRYLGNSMPCPRAGGDDHFVYSSKGFV